MKPKIALCSHKRADCGKFMSRQISVHPLPALFEPDDVVGGIAVVVDILRATTTITHALANGAGYIIPCGTVEQALDIRNDLPAGTCLLGGERGGIRIDGFDLSNSPDDYGPNAICAESVVSNPSAEDSTSCSTRAPAYSTSSPVICPLVPAQTMWTGSSELRNCSATADRFTNAPIKTWSAFFGANECPGAIGRSETDRLAANSVRTVVIRRIAQIKTIDPDAATFTTQQARARRQVVSDV